MADKELKSQGKASLYIHLTENGDTFCLPSNALVGYWIDALELKQKLMELDKQDGQLFVSSDNMNDEQSEATGIIFDLIDSFSLDVHAVDPHPAVRGYKRSYISYINSAINVSEIDIEGTEELLSEARALLENCDKEDSDYPEVLSECQSLEKQLEFARYAHKRLLDLELDICTEIKTAIQ